jgi:hypothetical protein
MLIIKKHQLVGYQASLKRHLGEYKLRYLGISEPGVFKYRGREVFEDHVLPLVDFRKILFEEAEPAGGCPDNS